MFDLVDSYRPNACLARRKAKRTSQGGRIRSDYMYMYLAARKLVESSSTMMIRIVQVREVGVPGMILFRVDPIVR